MIMDNQIPDYAFVPAKEVEEAHIVAVGKQGIYKTEQISNIKELFRKNIVIEEDILVPDIKPDLKEILLMDGTGILSNRIMDIQNVKEEPISISGFVNINGLYIADEAISSEAIIPLEAKIPFKEQIILKPEESGKLVVEINLEKVEYYVINERKYRVRLSLVILGRKYIQKTVELFQGIEGEDLKLRRENTTFTNILAWKMEPMEIEESLAIDNKAYPVKILKQKIDVIENYKQITQEKIIINGFVIVDILCMFNKTSDGEKETYLKQIQEKIEFTQFIPGGYKGQCHVGDLFFDCSNLKVLLDEVENENKILVKGEIITSFLVFQAISCEIITDAYHKERDFICDYELDEGVNFIGSSIGEGRIREIISPKQAEEDIRKILYVDEKIQNYQCKNENERISVEGSLLINLVCETEGKDDIEVISLKNTIPFRIDMQMPLLLGNEKIHEMIRVREIKAELINCKQIEISAGIFISAEIIESIAFKIAKNPVFEDKKGGERLPLMSIYVSKPGEDLWDIAKAFKTSEDAIRKVNTQDEEQISLGEKLLIVRG